MPAKVKKGDRVVVTAGRDKGKSGEVLRVYPSESRVLVAGVNVVKRHQRQTAARAGRHRVEGSADPSVEDRPCRSQDRRSDARRVQAAWRTGAWCALPKSPEKLSMSDAEEPKAKKPKAAKEPPPAEKKRKRASRSACRKGSKGREEKGRRRERRSACRGRGSRSAIPIMCRASRSIISTSCVRS